MLVYIKTVFDTLSLNLKLLCQNLSSNFFCYIVNLGPARKNEIMGVCLPPWTKWSECAPTWRGEVRPPNPPFLFVYFVRVRVSFRTELFSFQNWLAPTKIFISLPNGILSLSQYINKEFLWVTGTVLYRCMQWSTLYVLLGLITMWSFHCNQ